MLACLFGCDALFESGQISVSDEGKVILATGTDPASPLGRRMARLEGRAVTSFTGKERPVLRLAPSKHVSPIGPCSRGLDLAELALPGGSSPSPHKHASRSLTLHAMPSRRRSVGCHQGHQGHQAWKVWGG